MTVTPDFKDQSRRRLRTHCPHGHEFTAENTYWNPRGVRECMECRREKNRAWVSDYDGGRDEAVHDFAQDDATRGSRVDDPGEHHAPSSGTEAAAASAAAEVAPAFSGANERRLNHGGEPVGEVRGRPAESCPQPQLAEESSPAGTPKVGGAQPTGAVNRGETHKPPEYVTPPTSPPPKRKDARRSVLPATSSDASTSDRTMGWSPAVHAADLLGYARLMNGTCSTCGTINAHDGSPRCKCLRDLSPMGGGPKP